MKTAEELFNETLEGSQFKTYPDGLMDENQFSEALKEHDKEIKQLIDDMIKPLKKHLIQEEKRLETESPDDVPDISYFEDKGEYNALTELKNKL